MERVELALDGLWTGDSFGERFFYPQTQMLLGWREPPNPPWRHTDDTEMALSIAEVLRTHGQIDRDELASLFARRYHGDPDRGYGMMAHQILSQIRAGVPWQHASAKVFDGQGSMGNGGAMRAAPVGAYFADDFARVALEARKSAEVTHAHEEGKAGAIAVAVAAAWACQYRAGGTPPQGMLAMALEHMPPSETRARINRALTFPTDFPVAGAASHLGNGSRVIAQDTVPFAL
jgi:ADP-ribosylglycohydrolase